MSNTTKGAHPRGEGGLFSVQGREEEGGGQRERVEILMEAQLREHARTISDKSRE